MAKIDNDMVKGVRGAIGKELVYRRRNGKTFVSKYPDMSAVIPSKKQAESRNVFAEAVKYAAELLKDPEKAAAFSKKGKSAYLAAIKEYMLLNRGGGKAYNFNREYWEEALKGENLTERQLKTALFIEQAGRITNGDCQRLHGISKPTATRDLQVLVSRKILNVSAGKGAGAFYTMGSWWESIGS